MRIVQKSVIQYQLCSVCVKRSHVIIVGPYERTVLRGPGGFPYFKSRPGANQGIRSGLKENSGMGVGDGG